MSAQPLYIIAWKRRDGHGKPGQGKLRMTKEEAEKMAHDMNAEFPNVEHTVIEDKP
jgi:hypothetical protein